MGPCRIYKTAEMRGDGNMTDKNKTVTTGNSDGEDFTQCDKCNTVFSSGGNVCPYCGGSITLLQS